MHRIQHFTTEHLKQVVTENLNPLFHKMTRKGRKHFCYLSVTLFYITVLVFLSASTDITFTYKNTFCIKDLHL